MIHTQRSWVAFAAGVITCLAFVARAHAQAPAPRSESKPNERE